MTSHAYSGLPEFLSSSSAFIIHLDQQLESQSNSNKGESFARFVCKALPLCDIWDELDEPVLNPKKTHDNGVDFTSQHKSSKRRVAGQSKYRIRSVAEFDTIISKFKKFEQEESRQPIEQGDLFSTDKSRLAFKFVIVTSTNISKIKRRYEESKFPSVAFYNELLADDLLDIVDGDQLLSSLQKLYTRNYLIAPEIKLDVHTEIVQVNNVYISVVRGKTLQQLYSQYGSSLFFENIRDFLGVSRPGEIEKDATVNDAISETLAKNPDKMLGRNNGITFRAEAVERKGEKTLILRGGSIVNGCQTTMCVVSSHEHAKEALVMTKIVTNDDSWEVAKSANYQNKVTRIDLEIARFLWPQLVRKIATNLGYGMPETKETSISNILDDIHNTKISYDAIKLLYLGVFSRHPNNLFEGNYSEVRVDTLSAIGDKEMNERVMRILFELWVQNSIAREELQRRYKKHNERFLDIFKRFFSHENVKYQCLLAILTACGCVRDNLMNKSTMTEDDCARILHFVNKTEVILSKYPDFFNKVYIHAFNVLTDRILVDKKLDLNEMLQKMFDIVKSNSGAQFENVCMALENRIITDESISNLAEEIINAIQLTE